MTVFSDCRFSNCRFYVQLIAPFSDIARPSSAFPLSRAIASVMDLGPSWIGQKIRNEIRLCKHSMSLKLHWKQRWKRQLHDIISGSYRRLKSLFITLNSYSSPQGINIILTSKRSVRAPCSSRDVFGLKEVGWGPLCVKSRFLDQNEVAEILKGSSTPKRQGLKWPSQKLLFGPKPVS